MLSVVIVNYNQKGLVKNCLKSLLEAEVGLPLEIIVVDNDSSDGIEQMLKDRFPKVKFYQTGKNLGMGGGNNLGFRKANGDYVLIMNPDIFVLPQTIQKLLDYVQAQDNVGLIAPRLLNPDRTLQYTCYRWHKFWTPIYRRTFFGKLPWAENELKRFLMADFDHNKTSEVEWIQGSCWLIPKKVLSEVGFFDERFFMYFEDTDFCRRINQLGYKVVYHPEAEVIHLHRRQSADGQGISTLFNKLTRVHIYSWLKYMWKWR